MTVFEKNVAALAARIPDGAKIALPPDYSYCANALVRALVRRRAKGLHLVGVPAFGYQGDLLIGAGCVDTVETAAVTMGEYGLAPRFTAAVKAGELRLLDATCPAIHAGLQAAERGAPFSVMRGLIGSDILARRPDWRVIDNPFAAQQGIEGRDPVVAIPALKPDVTVFHAPKADRFGNVFIGVRRECMVMAHAASQAVITVERIVDGNLLDDVETAAGTIPSLYITALAEVARGAWPQALPGNQGYAADAVHLRDYARQAKSAEGFQAYLDAHVLEPLAEPALS
ncbi:MAG: CoA synthetase [Alphaproteobacteria bacterium]|nr:CoA synthetase [Alphaproteobacteria bacterium]